MKTTIRLLVVTSSFALALAGAPVSTGQPLGLTLVDKHRNSTRSGFTELRGPMSFDISEPELEKERIFLKLGSPTSPAINLELLKTGAVVIKPTSTNDVLRFDAEGASFRFHLTNKRLAVEGTLEVEVSMPGQRPFVLTSNEIAIERVPRDRRP
jgi:hypothetical protein